jgi:hypothetical protein
MVRRQSVNKLVLMNLGVPVGCVLLCDYLLLIKMIIATVDALLYYTRKRARFEYIFAI